MSAPTVLVTGGAGFVGSHTCKALAQAAFLPVTYDNLSNGVVEAVKWGPLETGNLHDEARLAAVVARHKPVGVLHFAAFIEAGESVREPVRFFQNNVAGTLALLRVMHLAGIDKIVFSSTAAVYGEPEVTPIPETHPLRPMNPYGRSKLMVEEVLRDVSAAEGLEERHVVVEVEVCFPEVGVKLVNLLGDVLLQKTHKLAAHLVELGLERVQLAGFRTAVDSPGAA